MLIESPIYFIYTQFNYDHFLEISKNFYALPSLIILAIFFLVIFILSKLRIGFSFISTNRYERVYSKYPPKLYVLFVTAFVFFALISLSVIYFDKIIMLFVFLTYIIIIALLHFSYMKEMRD